MSDEICRFKEEEDGQIVSLDDSHIERVRDRLAYLSPLTVRVVATCAWRIARYMFVSLEALKMYCVMRAIPA